MFTIIRSLLVLAVLAGAAFFFIPSRSPTVEEIYLQSPFKWGRALKEVSETDLEIHVKKILYDEATSRELLDFAGMMLCELHLRKYAKTNQADLKVFREVIKTKSGICFAGTSHCIETAGLKRALVDQYVDDNDILHPYSQNEVSKKLISMWKKSESLESFEEFLIKNISNQDQEALKKGRVLYLTPKQAKKYLITFSRQKIKIGGKPPKNSKYIFALSSDGKRMLAGIKKRGHFHHSSFFSGLPVSCAGHFYIEDGKITRVTLDSGHYKPTAAHGENLRAFLAREECLGVAAAENLKIVPHKSALQIS